MQEFFSGKIKEFWSGSLIGFIAGVNLLFNGPVTWSDYVLVYTVKFFAVILFSLASGIMTVAAKDFYTHIIRPWSVRWMRNRKEKKEMKAHDVEKELED
jgi:nicotinamide riboside transporter PnuC